MAANISNGQYVNITSGEVRITAFAQNAEGRTKIFSIPFSTPTGGISVSLDTILGRNREINDIFNKPGAFAGSTKGKEILVAKDGSMTLKDDFVYLSNKNATTIEKTKSLMRSIAMGDMFDSTAEITLGGEAEATPRPYKIVGTNGNRKLTTSATGGQAFGLLTQLDGRLIIPQAAAIGVGGSIDTATSSNTRITAYNKSSICVMFEILTKFNNLKSEGYRFVYTLNSNFKYQEADDANEVSFDQMMLSDVRYINKFFYKGLSTGEYEGVSSPKVPARKVKVGTKNVAMFKSLIDLATGDPLTLPSFVITTTNTVEAYSTAVDDICIGFFTATGANKKSFYSILKCTEITPAVVWQHVNNTIGLTTNTLTSQLLVTEAELLTASPPVLYEIYDFDFEAEDFRQAPLVAV